MISQVSKIIAFLCLCVCVCVREGRRMGKLGRFNVEDLMTASQWGRRTEILR